MHLGGESAQVKRTRSLKNFENARGFLPRVQGWQEVISVAQMVKNLPAVQEIWVREDLSPGSGRSPGEENSNPLQHSCLENPMDRGAWQATVHGVRKSRTQLSN